MGARVVGKAELTLMGSTGSSIDPVLTTHIADDYLFVFVGADTTANDISDGGWTSAFQNADATHSVRGVYKKCTSSSETISTITFTSCSNAFAVCITIRGADLTTFLDVTPVTADLPSAAPARLAMPLITPTSAGTLNLFFVATDTGRNPQWEPGVMSLIQQDTVGGVTGAAVGWIWHPTADQIPQKYLWMTRQFDNGPAATVSIRSADSNSPPRSSLSATPCLPLAPLNHAGSSGSPNGYPAWTLINPVSGGISAVDSVSTYYAAPTSDAGAGVTLDQVTSRAIASTDGQLAMWGCTFDTTGAVDLTGVDIVLHAAVFGGNYGINLGKLSAHGLMFGLGSSASDYRIWDIAAKDADADGLGIDCTLIDPSDTTNAYTGGTFDIENVDRAFFLGLDDGTSTAGMRWIANQLARVQTATVIGGNATEPATFETFKSIVNSANLLTVQKLGNRQYKVFQPLSIGDGSSAVHFNDSGVSVEFAKIADRAERELQYQGSKLSLTIDNPSGSPVTIKDSLLSSPSEWDLIFDVAGTLDLSGTIIRNAAITFTAITSITGATFRGCAEIPEGCDFSGGNTFDNPSGTQAYTITGATDTALQTALNLLANCTFSNSTTYGLKIAYTGTGNISLNAPSNLTVDELLYTATASSALTIVVGSSGSSFPSTAIGGSATGVTISNDKTLTVSINVTGAEITLLENGTQTEIDHEETNASGTYTYVYTYSSDTAADLQVFKPGYKPYWNDAVTLGNADQTITVTLEAEAAYG